MAAKNTPGMSGAKQSKEERRAAAREKARILREQQEKRAKRNRMLVIVGVVLSVALVVLAIVKIVSAGTSDFGEYDGKAREAKLANVTDSYGIALGKSGQATATVNADLPKVEVYSDYMCIHCTNLEDRSTSSIEQHMAAGDVQIINYPVAILGQDFSNLGAAAAFYVATYAPEQYEAFHATMFDRSYKVLVDRTDAQPTAGEIADMAKSVGVPDDVVNDLPASITSDAWTKVTEEATAKFRDAGFQGTPTVLANGKEDTSWGAENGLGAVFDALLSESK